MDELWSGVAVVGAPSVEREQQLAHGSYTLVVFAGPMLLAALIEATVLPFSDRTPRRRFAVAALLLLSASLLGCAIAPSAWILCAGLAVAGACSGAACGTAQAELIELHGGAAERAMMRWTLFGAVGDLLVPLFLAAVLGAGGSYRIALIAIAAVLAVQALVIARGPRAQKLVAIDGDEPAISLRQDGWRAVRRPALWAWLFGASICTLLDELVAALTALRIRQDLGSTEAFAAAALTALSFGSVAGAFATDRVLDRVSPRRLLLGSAIVAGSSLLLVAYARSLPLLAVALVVLGASAAVHYPLAKARCYAAVPESPGLVNAMGQVFVIIDIAAPIAAGAVADRYGLGMALTSLLVQPLAILVLGLSLRRSAERK